jgi:hypothetical protein
MTVCIPGKAHWIGSLALAGGREIKFCITQRFEIEHGALRPVSDPDLVATANCCCLRYD